MQTGFKDKTLIALAGFVIVVCALVLWNDQWFIERFLQKRSGLKTFGSVVYLSGEVRRKIYDDFLWLNLSEKSEIYEGDSVFTNHGTTAEVMIQETKSILTLEPSTLVVFRRIQGELSLEVKQGTVLGKFYGNQRLKIISDRGISELSNSAESSQVEISAAPDPGAYVVKVKSGEAKLSSQNQQQDLKANDMAKISGAAVQVKTYNVGLISPKDYDRVKKDKTEVVFFTFSVPKTSTSFKLLVATDEGFFRPVLSQTGTRQDCEEKGDRLVCSLRSRVVGLGEMFWKVQAASDESAKGRFNLFFDAAPTLVSPSFGTVIELAKKNDEAVRLEWKDHSGAREFELQLARDKDFLKMIHETVVAGQNYAIPPLPEGVFFWRIKVKGENEWSSISRFFVQKEAVAGAPKPESPPSQKAMTAAVFPAHVPFVWQARADTASYVLEISQNPGFEPLLFSESLVRTNYNWQAPSEGTYYWRVRSVLKTEQVTAFSTPIYFTIRKSK